MTSVSSHDLVNECAVCHEKVSAVNWKTKLERNMRIFDGFFFIYEGVVQLM